MNNHKFKIGDKVKIKSEELEYVMERNLFKNAIGTVLLTYESIDRVVVAFRKSELITRDLTYRFKSKHLALLSSQRVFHPRLIPKPKSGVEKYANELIKKYMKNHYPEFKF